MLPVARKPIVQYVLEELLANGVEQILLITGRSKTAIENHFDTDPELLRTLNSRKMTHLASQTDFEHLKAHIFYTRQHQQKGLGDAVLCGESFAGEQPVVVALGDSILGLHAKSSCVSRMIQLFESRRASCVVAVEEVPPEETRNYGVIRAREGKDGCLNVLDLIEKPRPEEAPSNLAIAGRYVFSPLIFDMLRRVQADSKGEIQLTDAIRFLCEEGKRVLAVKLPPSEKRYDIGNFASYYATFVEFALADPDYGKELRDYLQTLLNTP